MAVAQKMRAGTVGYNRFGPELSAPFGGFKESGVGREYGLEGLRAFCEVKNIHGL
jgi:aldehyde dehydrogenase (NAD+)